MIEILKKIRRALLRWLKLRPVDKVFSKLRSQGVSGFDRGLEVFGYTGAYHTQNYFKYVKELHVWELDQSCEPALRRNLPGAVIKITDSFEEIERTPLKFDLVVIDNHQGLYGGKYCEHFEMLPKAFRVLKPEATLIMNILPDVSQGAKRYGALDPEHVNRRKAWYGTEEAISLSEEFLLSFYESLCSQHGFKTRFSFVCKRNDIVSYLVLHVKRSG